MIKDILEYNKRFVENKEYVQYQTSKFPDKKLAILTCMDTRLTQLLPAALGIKNGDAKIIKNAGAVVSHPYGSVVKSLLVAILELGVQEIMVIGHTDCGVQGLDAKEMIAKMERRGVSKENITRLTESGFDVEGWLGGFDSVEESVRNAVTVLQSHPLIPRDVVIRGYIMDIVTGEVQEEPIS